MDDFAEHEGFEPPVAFYTTLVFETSTIGPSVNAPQW